MSSSHGPKGRMDRRLTSTPRTFPSNGGAPIHFERVAMVSKPVQPNTPTDASYLLRVPQDP